MAVYCVHLADREGDTTHHGDFVGEGRRHGGRLQVRLVIDAALSVFIYFVVVEDEWRGNVGGHLVRR